MITISIVTKELSKIKVIKSIKEKHADTIQEWIDSGKSIDVDYPDNAESIIDMLIDRHSSSVSYSVFKKHTYPLFQ